MESEPEDSESDDGILQVVLWDITLACLRFRRGLVDEQCFNSGDQSVKHTIGSRVEWDPELECNRVQICYE